MSLDLPRSSSTQLGGREIVVDADLFSMSRARLHITVDLDGILVLFFLVDPSNLTITRVSRMLGMYQ